MRKAPTGDAIPITNLTSGFFVSYAEVPSAGFELYEAAGAPGSPREPWLRMAGDPAAETFPIRREPTVAEPQLLLRFAMIAEAPSVAGILDFANRWGWLANCATPAGGALDDGRQWRGEKLSLWSRQLLEFRAIFELWRAVDIVATGVATGQEDRASAHRRLREAISWTADGTRFEVHVGARNDGTEFARLPEAARRVELNMVLEKGRHPVTDEILEPMSPPDLVSPGRFFIVETLDRILAAHARPIVLWPKSGAVVRVAPDCLLGAVYYQLALQLAGPEASLRQCRNRQCPNGGLFLAGRRDKHYCDKGCREQEGYYLRRTGGTHKA